MDKILAKIAEIAEAENVAPETRLADLELWDSLAVISFMAYVKSEHGVEFDNIAVVNGAGTAGELCRITIDRTSRA